MKSASKMQISIKNLGVIQTANIELNGITILTGLNDTGKSFISKLIFSIISTIKNAVGYNEDEKAQLLIQNLERINIRRIRATSTNPQARDITLHLNQLYDDFLQHFRFSKFTAPQALLLILDNFYTQTQDSLRFFDETKSRITRADFSVLRSEMQENYNQIRKMLLIQEDEESLYLSYFQKVIIPELFEGAINTIENESILEVKIAEGPTVIVSIIIQNNIINSFKYNSTLNPLFKRDSTLIETPTVISLNKYFNPVQYYRLTTGTLPFQYEDILSKIRTTADTSPRDFYPEIMEQIAAIIDGEVIYDTDKKSITFRKQNKVVKSDSIATGIKSFGLLQMLIKNGHIDPDVILIIDEPEVHLHPAWEILYARILFAIAKAGVLVLISTHSAYLVQFIINHTELYKMAGKVKFYFAEKDPQTNTSSFTDVTANHDPVLKALAKPMRDTYNN